MTRPDGPLALLRNNPGFFRLWVGQTISQTGDWFAGTAVLALGLSLTGSGLTVALQLASRMIPLFLLAPVAGIISDRVDRKRLAVWVDVLRAVVAIGFIFIRRPEQVPLTYVLMFLLSVGGVLHFPAVRSIMPDVVPRHQLVAANALIRSTFGFTQVLGSALGGTVAVFLGRDLAFMFNAASFLVAAVCVASIALERRLRDRPPETGRGQVWAGFRLIATSSLLLTVLVVEVSGAIGQGAGQVLRSYFGHMVFGGRDLGIGLLNAGLGLGRIIGPLLFARRLSAEPEHLVRWLGPLCMVHGLAYGLFAVSWSLSAGVAAQFLLGAVDFVKDTCLGTIIMVMVPEHVRGRVFAAELVLIRLTHFCVQLLVGGLLILVSPRALVVGTGVLPLIVCGLTLVFLRHKWERR